MTRKWWFASFLVMAFLAVMTTARANDPVAEPFEDPAYVPGDPLSDVWAQADPDSTDIFTIEDVGPDHNKVVRMDASGPDPGPAFPANNTQYSPWDGPGRNAGALWFRVDIEKGTPLNGTALTTNIWQLNFIRGNGQSVILLYGGLGTVGMKGSNSLFNAGPVNLDAGWNSVVVMNDTNQNPNTRMWLNGIPVLSFNATSGAAQSGTSSAARTVFSRLSRGGTGDAFEGSMRFDNVITANTYAEIPEPSTMVLLGLGVVPFGAMIYRRRRKSA